MDKEVRVDFPLETQVFREVKGFTRRPISRIWGPGVSNCLILIMSIG